MSRGSELNLSKEWFVLAVILAIVSVIFMFGLWNLVAPTGISVSIVRSECGPTYGYSVTISTIATGMLVYSAYRIIRLNRVDSLSLLLLLVAMVMFTITAYSVYSFSSSIC
ncbi:hypothetical protein [Caldivirga sp.]|uniref:hypothetical protein n=1 Tax=Caldivirga sp. TaxID=2080243 RepID=UPI0025C184B1|nr:hypothetical protein [Caldivirga sp.]